MEVQTFVLCKELKKVGSGSEFDASLIGLHSFFSKDGAFPLDCQMPYFILLRRGRRDVDETITIRFKLIDPDGKPAGKPDDVSARGTFPKGHMFMTLHGLIEFSFPGVGDFRLDITADEHKLGSTYQYAIEITK